MKYPFKQIGYLMVDGTAGAMSGQFFYEVL